MLNLKLIVRESFFVLWVQLLVASSFHPIAEAKPRPEKKHAAASIRLPSRQALLSKSQLSYQASGGFTEVDSYGVIISCVDGKISTLRSLRNVRHGTIRKLGTMSQDEYLALWHQLARRRVLDIKDGPELKQDVLDEFTVDFEAKVGNRTNKFKAIACSRPEAARYFAILSMMDQASGMKAVWDSREKTVKNN